MTLTYGSEPEIVKYCLTPTISQQLLERWIDGRWFVAGIFKTMQIYKISKDNLNLSKMYYPVWILLLLLLSVNSVLWLHRVLLHRVLLGFKGWCISYPKHWDMETRWHFYILYSLTWYLKTAKWPKKWPLKDKQWPRMGRYL